jgi:hypothetical protein
MMKPRTAAEPCRRLWVQRKRPGALQSPVAQHFDQRPLASVYLRLRFFQLN